MGNSDDDKDKGDLTRIEDLSDFFHRPDPDADNALQDSEDLPSESDPTESFEVEELLKNDSNDSEEEHLSDDIVTDSLDFSSDTDNETQDFLNNTDNGPSEFSEHTDTESPNDASSEVQSFLSDTESEVQSFSDNTESEVPDFSDDTDSEVQDFSDNTESEVQDFSDNTESEVPDFSGDTESEVQDFSDNTESDIQSFSDDTSNEEDQKKSESIPLPPSEISSISKKSPEEFNDIRSFGNNISYGKITSGGNPPFSIILKNIKYKEDAITIMELLKEYQIIDEQNEQAMKQSLDYGALLISQISEYSAIFLAHRLRRFNLTIEVGLSDELSPSKSYSKEKKGIITKSNLSQNKVESIKINKQNIDISSIVVTTTQILEDYTIERYFGPVTTDLVLLQDEIKDFKLPDIDSNHQTLDEDKEMHLTISEKCQQLIKELQKLAHKMGGNAIIGLNHQLIPIPSHQEEYKLVSTGTVVWINSNDTKS